MLKIFCFHFYLFASIIVCCPILVKSQEITDAVGYSFKRGFYTDSFQLALSSETAGSIIRYTLDGSKPSLINGKDYTGPVTIKSTAMVRTYAYAPGFEDSKIKTHTFIFPQQVIRQENNMLADYGYDYSSEETGRVFWTEEMDPEIVDDPVYKDEVFQGFFDIPTLSVVMAKEDLWGENGIHWGDNLEEDGDEWEKECSIEMIYPEDYSGDSLKNWQENCGIKIQGGGGRWDKGTYDHKQSFTLVFKKKYGAGKLKNEIFKGAPYGRETVCGKYDRIILRAGHNKSWGADWDREKSVFTRDQLGRDLQILMSGFGSHGTFVHLYLNGKYWGLYNPCERPDHNFLANYLGGESEDYFYAKGKNHDASEDRDGEAGQSETRFFEAASRNYSEMLFSEMQNWILIDESIASYLVFGYSNPGDGPQYYFGNCNNPEGPVVWIPWDIEDSFDGGSRRSGPPNIDNMLKSKLGGDNGFQAFWTNVDFRMHFNDLVYKHFYNDGVMTDENVIKVWDSLASNIYRPIVCESARWGDERSSNPMDRDNEWDEARIAVRNDLQGRGNNFITKLRGRGYFSGLHAPLYLYQDSVISSSILEINTSSSITIERQGNEGVVYFTIDGTDPRTWDLKAEVSSDAISQDGVIITEPTTLKARIKHDNEWSPLHEIFVETGGNQISLNIEPKEAIYTEPDNLNLTHSTYKLLLYPNPVKDKLFLSEPEHYRLFSAMGKLLKEAYGSEVLLGNLPNGLYIIIIDNKPYKVLKTN